MTINTSRLVCDALTSTAGRRRALATRLAVIAESHDDAAGVVDLLKEAAALDAVAKSYQDVIDATPSDPEPTRPASPAVVAPATTGAVVDEHGTPTDPDTLTERRRSIDPTEALAQRAKETTP